MKATEIRKQPCPCIDCICLPICRFKYLGRLFDECELVDSYIPRWSTKKRSDLKRMFTLEKILNPELWYTRRTANDEPVMYSNDYITDPPEPIVVLKMLQ